MDVAVAEAEYQRTIVTECTKSIHNPIKRNKLPLFNKPQPGQQNVRPTGKKGFSLHSCTLSLLAEKGKAICGSLCGLLSLRCQKVVKNCSSAYAHKSALAVHVSRQI